MITQSTVYISFKENNGTLRVSRNHGVDTHERRGSKTKHFRTVRREAEISGRQRQGSRKRPPML